jgi:hypothetical protein
MGLKRGLKGFGLRGKEGERDESTLLYDLLILYASCIDIGALRAHVVVLSGFYKPIYQTLRIKCANDGKYWFYFFVLPHKTLHALHHTPPKYIA